jgi:7,8-dihydropterin-6-yl-methyl-4-(beta-D-ribofuranosyl)aminobenzene 5'-phosphate synthase
MNFTKKRHSIAAAIFLILIVGANFVFSINLDEEISAQLQLEPCEGSLTILYDNYHYETGTRAEWGYSCLIETKDMIILFDTGGEEEVFQYNIEALGVDVSEIDCVVISHEHWDHVGGIGVVLSRNPDIPVYVPDGFPYHLMSNIRSLGGNCIETGNATIITDSISTTSTLNGPPNEQALMVQTDDGLILVTGCSHPGIENLAKNAYELTEESILIVIGGFHLGNAGNYQLSRICDELEEIGVVGISATHCTGDNSIDYFRERFGENYIESGVGFYLEF